MVPECCDGSRVLLGVSGSIAVYKAIEVTRKLQQAQIRVQVAMTSSAQQFVTSLTFQAITGHPVFDDLWVSKGRIEHVEQSHDMDLLIVAPASANILAKMATGLADDPVTTTALSTRAHILVAPAMEDGMWRHPATQHNMQILRDRGVWVVGPTEGVLASGRVGLGRMASPDEIVDAALHILHPPPLSLKGDRIVVTAGPTQEMIDPVRMLSNRSTGAMGIALSEEAVRRGAQVCLVLGPTHLKPRDNNHLRVVRVESASEMLAAVQAELAECTMFVGAAAVSDFRIANPRTSKWKRSDSEATHLELVENTDILKIATARLRALREDAWVMGFAAETEDLEQHARAKLERKGCDVVIGNIVGPNRGFGEGRTEVLVVSRQQPAEVLGPATKSEIGSLIWDKVAQMRGKFH